MFGRLKWWIEMETAMGQRGCDDAAGIYDGQVSRSEIALQQERHAPNSTDYDRMQYDKEVMCLRESLPHYEYDRSRTNRAAQ